MSRLTDRARSNKLQADDLVGGVSTIPNLGAYGIDAFTPILNPPQSTILGIGRISQRPVVKNGLLSIAHTCWLSLTFNHRVADGAPAAKVLDAVEHMMNNPVFIYGLIKD